MDMKAWLTENLLQSRTFWGAAFLVLTGLVTWVIVVPKDLAGWVALMGSLTTIVGGWVAANKITDAQRAGG